MTTTQRQLQTGAPSEDRALQPGSHPVYPQWPISAPGPMTTPPPAGMKPINAIRREQVTEVGYSQEPGSIEVELPQPVAPVVLEQPATAQKVLGRRKERL